MTKRFANKVVLITGAATGIGHAAALLFAAEGGKLVIADVNETGAKRTVDMIKRDGGEALFVPTDVAKEADCRRMVERTIATFGRLDVAFNNAGVSHPSKPFSEETEESFDRTIAVNLKGVFLSMKYEIPALLATGGGAIVNTSSVAGIAGEGGIAIYSASKHGVVGLTRSAAIEYAARGIRVNALCPGGTRTEMLTQWFSEPGVEAYITGKHPIGRMAEPIEPARVALFLASDDASFVTGATFAVDGGLTAG